LTHKGDGLIQEGSGIVGGVEEESAEEISAPFDTVLDLVGEVSQGAHRDRLFRWILGISIALSLVWNDHL
jgi:hypothetical protein